MRPLKTTADAAVALGCSVRTVQSYCATYDIGTRFGRMFLLSDDDVACLAKMVKPVGCPKFSDEKFRNGGRPKSNAK